MESKKYQLLKRVQEEIGDEYFEILQIASIVEIVSEVVSNRNIREKAQEFLEYCRKEAEKLLDK